MHFVEKDVPCFLGNAAQRSVADRSRLLINFLEHEMLEAALLRHDRVPVHVLGCALHGIAVEIRYSRTLARDGRKIAVGEEEKIPRVIQQRRNIGSHEVFVLAQSYNDWRTIARRKDFVWFVG